MPTFAATTPVREGPARIVASVLALVLGVLFALGCEEAAPPEAVTAASEKAPKAPALPRIKWLNQGSDTSPERWLASREAKADLDDTDPAVVALRSDLNTAAQRFRDPPRMIANRAVQLEEMLASVGIDEHAPELILLLSSVATDDRLRVGFGAIGEHYFNLRKQGLGREAALEQLKQTSSLDANNTRRG